ncbi:MAG: 4-alpha-glucanotransferase [Bacteroidales bacterium]|nr:4-alpha-glucanotransferase [Bacteroidales bacterium]
MRIRISLNYRALWGQRLVLVTEGRQYPMEGHEDGLWTLTLEDMPSSGEYCFLLCDEAGKQLRCEASGHSYSSRAVKELLIKDKWNDVSENAPFKTGFFKDVIFKRSDEGKRSASGYLALNVCAPTLRPGERLAISGDFNDWGSPVPMDSSAFPVWKISLPGDASFEYKFLIISDDPFIPVQWESGVNRYYNADDAGSAHVIVNEPEPVFKRNNWRGAGVAVPVFSLRSREGFGVGEFNDIKLLVDWAAETGQNVIQLLPINDTTMTHSWTDSYPYNANTTFALHPQFIHLPAAGVKENKEYKALQEELNALPKIDYEKVNSAKNALLKEVYESASGRKVLASTAFKKFYDANVSWLEPYAVFCCLRDKYKTPDFSKWGKMANYSPKAVAKWAREHQEEVGYHYFVQFHLDKQLKEVVAYAHSKGVALKGDLPIGISRTSVDAWVYPELYHLDSQAGAPPDAFSTLGQNWGFPTYNWEKMSEDGFAWWKARMHKMSEYFDAFRIDHILGFFRIWEIPMDAVHGLLGHFNPALPFSEDELAANGFNISSGLYSKPLLYDWILNEIFGVKADVVRQKYIVDGALAPEVSTQRKVVETVEDEDIKNGLLALLDDVLFVEDPRKKGYWHPRISAQNSYAFRCLNDGQKEAFTRLHDDFFYRRHNDFWRDSAMFKLPSILSSTGMLTCGEDLGMIPECVPSVMNELGILSLEIQRMPKSVTEEFANPAVYPYRCVCATGTHDTSNIRAWWEEDREVTEHFWRNMLHRGDDMPWFCEPWVAEMIVKSHLDSPAMLCILPLQDYLATDEDLRYPGDPADERINVPAIPRFYWRYRMHITLEDLIANRSFTQKLSGMISASGRGK